MQSPIIENQPNKPEEPKFGERFEDLGLSEALLRAVQRAGHTAPTAIQTQAIPLVLAGKDVIGCAQTGTGKTAAFALPILQRLAAGIQARPVPAVRALILSPTRELAAQIEQSFIRYGGNSNLRYAVVFGGVGFNEQLRALRRGVDIVVATPGRLEDLMRQGAISLSKVEIFVLDEADRMLDQGFFPAIERIVSKLPLERQTLCFSATLPIEVKPLIQRMLKQPSHIQVAPVSSTPDRVEQSAYFVDFKDKGALLKHLIDTDAVSRAVVFTRTKRGADRVARHLNGASVNAEAIHGDKSQNARNRTLAQFRAGRLHVLVATDVAARGIDIDGISHVINFDLPMDVESYVHRIGRTARAGAQGKALSLCTSEDRGQLARIERLIKRRVPVVLDHPFALTPEAAARENERARQAQASQGAGARNAGGQSQFRPRKSRFSQSGSGGRAS